MDTGFDPRSASHQNAPRQPSARRESARVRDLMTTDIEVCDADTDVYYAARMMADRDCGAIPVVEGTDSMRVIGMVTDRDVVVRLIAEGIDPHERQVNSCMSRNILTVRADMDLHDCLHRMEERKVRRAPVVDDTGRCIGMIAQADIARTAGVHDSAEFVKEISQPGQGSAGLSH